MGEPPPGSPGEEAERLVVAALSALSMATRGWLDQVDAEHHVATGSTECCVCPLCRAITAVRDPSPELVERLATGAAELAGGVTGLLRAFGETLGRPAGSGTGHPGSTHPGSTPRPQPGDEAAAGDDPWRSATRTGGHGDPDIPHPPPVAPAKIAKKAVRKVVPKGDAAGPDVR
jgi:hypothetical protein